MGASWGNNGKVFCHHLSPIANELQTPESPAGAPVDTAIQGMDPQPTSPRTELDLMTEQDLGAHLKVCRRQLGESGAGADDVSCIHR